MPREVFIVPEDDREAVLAWIEGHTGPSGDSAEPLYPKGLRSYAEQVDVDIRTLVRALEGGTVRMRSWQKIASEYYCWTRPDELTAALRQIRSVRS